MASGVTYQGAELIESQFLEAGSFNGKKVARKIVSIRTGVKLKNERGTSVKPAFRLEGEEKEWILNTTNLKSLAKLYGYQAEGFVGKWVVLHGVIVEAFGSEKLSIRVDVDATRKYNASKAGKAETERVEPPPAPHQDDFDPDTGEVIG